MFSITTLVIDAVTDELVEQYRRIFKSRQPDHAAAIATAVRLSLDRIALSDALYHNLEHTVMVTLLGMQILRGREIATRVTPDDWLHMTVALLCHDVGYVRGACRGDTATEAMVDEQGRTVTIPRGASDAWLTPYHVDRSKIFVRERAEVIGCIDADRVAHAIELTRFPIPQDDEHSATDSEGGLVRAADLIGQLADPYYLRNHTALFAEFVETGIAAKLGYATSADLTDNYPKFFWGTIERYIAEGLRYLALTQEGRQWTANLYAHVFAVEHLRWRMGPQSDMPTRPAPPA